MASAHVGLEDQHVLICLGGPQLGDPLGRLPIGDARIVQPGSDHQRRIGLCAHLIIRRIAADQLKIRQRSDRIAPFRPFAGRERQAVIEHGVEHVHKRHMRHHGPEQLRRLIHDGAHQFAAGRTAAGRDHPRRGPAGLNQALGGIDEIVERVGALGQFAIEIPAIAQIVAAANLRDGKGDAATQQAQAIGRKARHGRDAISAVAVKVQLAGAVRLEALFVHDRHGHLHAVPRGDKHALAFILAGVIA